MLALLVHSKMPFSMLMMGGFIKPLMTLWAFGLNTRLLEYNNIVSFTVDESLIRGKTPLKARWKSEILPSILLAISVYTFSIDVAASYWAMTDSQASWWKTLERLMVNLGNSTNVSSMLTAIGLAGMYSTDASHGALNMIFGKHWQPWTQYLQTRFPVPHGVTREMTYVNFWIVLFLEVLASPLFTVFSGAAQSLDEDAVQQMPSRMQRIDVRCLWHTYTWVFHALAGIALLGAYAYFWFFASFGMAGIVVAKTMTDCLLPRMLRARRFFEANPDTIDASIRFVEDHPLAFSIFFLASAVFGVVLPLGIPLTLLLFDGHGYFEALAKEWNAREYATYFGALQKGVMHQVNWVATFTSWIV